MPKSKVEANIKEDPIFNKKHHILHSSPSIKGHTSHIEQVRGKRNIFFTPYVHILSLRLTLRFFLLRFFTPYVHTLSLRLTSTLLHCEDR
jgi:hypothetical protein